MTDVLSTKEIFHRATLRISKRTEKKAISISIASGIDVLISNEEVTSEEHKTKSSLKISFI